MAPAKHYTWRSMLTASCSLLLLAAAACSSRPSRKREEGSAGSQAASQANPGEPGVIGADYCLETLMKKSPGPATPVHFSYKKSDSDGPSNTDFEADLAGDNFDVIINRRYPAPPDLVERNHIRGVKPIPIKDGFAEEVDKNHYVRSDASGWTMGSTSMAQGGTPWSLFILKPPFTRAGSETLSGHPTIKYTVDTTHQSQLDKFAGIAGMQVKDYNITGSVWVTRDTACILQWNIDMEEDGKDGKISKSHYEGLVRN